MASMYKLILTSLVKVIFIASTVLGPSYASVSFDIECSAPNLNYLNRFELKQTLVAYENHQDDSLSPFEKESYRVYSTTLKTKLTKAGNNGETSQEELKLSGTIKKIVSPFTKEPFYAVKLKDGAQEVLAQLNFNYPGALTSSIKTADGRLYKAQCKLTVIKGCLFGDALYQTLENRNFTVVELGQELKVIPDFDEEGQAVNTKKVTRTYKDGHEFSAWYTFQDEVDGGNTYGVIEDLAGNIVATIADSDIYDCQVNR
jgi:hypothetical protein